MVRLNTAKNETVKEEMTVEIVLGALVDWFHGKVKNKVIKWIAIVIIFFIGFSLAFVEWSGQFSEWSGEVND